VIFNSAIEATTVNQPGQTDLPARLFVETTTHCNMACPMCVKQTEHSGIVDGHLPLDIFRTLLPALPSLEALLLNGIGEPLLHPQLEEFITLARQDMPAEGWIGFQSNGLLLDIRRATALAAAGLDRICLSLDAVTPETFARLRAGGEIGAMHRAFAALRQAKKLQPGSRLRSGVEFVVMRENVRQLPDVLRWASRQGAEFAIVTQLMPYSMAQLDQVAYGTGTDAAAELFSRWRQRGIEQGVDILAASLDSWRSAASRDLKVKSLVEGMKAEARNREIFLNLKELQEQGATRQHEIAAIFAEAESVAQSLGMELKLPAILPRQQRHCAFVEKGGAFIDWTGGVHPCYNLWHGYRCFVNGWERTVKPKVFGDLQQKSLQDIWTDEDFRSFRENVLKYDHSYCASCGVAPCDYIQAEDFEQDCYLKSEPCGACLWSMGLLQCLQ